MLRLFLERHLVWQLVVFLIVLMYRVSIDFIVTPLIEETFLRRTEEYGSQLVVRKCPACEAVKRSGDLRVILFRSRFSIFPSLLCEQPAASKHSPSGTTSRHAYRCGAQYLLFMYPFLS